MIIIYLLCGNQDWSRALLRGAPDDPRFKYIKYDLTTLFKYIG